MLSKNSAFFYIWETVDFPIKITSEDEQVKVLENVSNVVVSLKQGTININKDIADTDIALDIENDIINLHLSQKETGQFKKGELILQVNILYDDNERDTTAQVAIEALDNLYKKVM